LGRSLSNFSLSLAECLSRLHRSLLSLGLSPSSLILPSGSTPCALALLFPNPSITNGFASGRPSPTNYFPNPPPLPLREAHMGLLTASVSTLPPFLSFRLPSVSYLSIRIASSPQHRFFSFTNPSFVTSPSSSLFFFPASLLPLLRWFSSQSAEEG
jgi:hypothetical protein